MNTRKISIYLTFLCEKSINSHWNRIHHDVFIPIRWWSWFDLNHFQIMWNCLNKFLLRACDYKCMTPNRNTFGNVARSWNLRATFFMTFGWHLFALLLNVDILSHRQCHINIFDEWIPCAQKRVATCTLYNEHCNMVQHAAAVRIPNSIDWIAFN